VALRLESGYMPDGWLGPLCLNKLHYDFSDPAVVESEWKKLKAELQKQIAGLDTGLPATYTS